MKAFRLLTLLPLLLGGCRIDTVIQGEGSVTSANGAFNCDQNGGDCTQQYTSPGTETLIATPAPGHTLSRWIGCNYQSLLTCLTPITQGAIDGDLEWTITAEFEPTMPPTQAATYTYNALGQRITKTVAGKTTVFQYDMDGTLIAELDNYGQPLRQHIHINSQPIAQLSTNPGNGKVNIQYVHTDHLGAPSLLTDAQQTIVWDIEATPFGETFIDYAAVEHKGRFPGQYKDEESGLHYNYFRDYDSSTGRYIQSDPIGLAGGLNTYSYVAQNPVLSIDPYGLDTVTYGANLRIPSWLSGPMQRMLGLEVPAHGVSFGVAYSFPGMFGGERDRGVYFSVDVAGFEGGGKITEGFTYQGGSVCDLAGEGQDLAGQLGPLGGGVVLDSGGNFRGISVQRGIGAAGGWSYNATVVYSQKHGLLSP